MSRELGFGSAVYGLGAGLFFIGYLILEVPVASIVAKGSARLWLSVMLVAWGIAATAMGTVHGVKAFYSYRILLGVAEAGFFPGILIYLSGWFPKRDRARAVGALAVGLPAANLIGGPISGFLLSRNWLQVPGWRWLFIMEGVPSIIAGFLTYRYLVDSPAEARWLDKDERGWLANKLSMERLQASAESRSNVLGSRNLNTPLILLAAVWFLDNMGVYGFNFWLPMIVKRMTGFSSATVAVLAATPFVGALIASALVSLSSDRKGERRFHTAIPMATFATGLLFSVVWSSMPVVSLGMLCLAALGLTSGTPGFWAIATSAGGTSGSTSIAIITSAGALGGFCGPYVMGSLKSATGTFSAGLSVLASAVMIAATILLLAARRRTNS